MEHNLGVSAWLARRARTSPNRIAVIAKNTRLSFRELDERISRLVAGLADLGLGRGDRLAFLGENQLAAIELLAACGTLGAIHVPVHPGFDDDVLADVLAQADPTVLVVADRLASRVARIGAANRVPVYRRVSELAGLGAGSAPPGDVPVSLDDPCVIAFTSGTTGRSKGVVLTHGNLLANASNVIDAIDWGADARLLVSAPLYRMGGLGFALPMLLRGGCCVLQERPDPDEAARLIETHALTAVFDSVGALGALLAAADRGGRDLSSLRICATGGSPVPWSLVRAFADRGLVLQPGYGLTEAAPVVLVVDRDEVAGHPGAAGRPVPLTSVKVVDSQLHEVPRGTLGELMVRGPSVTPGYWRNPEHSARVLVDGWLRTGDVARMDPDGMVSILGRVDDALVLDGRRFHPGQLEAALVDLGARRAAVVQERPEGDPVVYVSGIGPGRDDELARVARMHLTRRNVGVVLCRELPLNPNGKIVRSRLSAAGGRSFRISSVPRSPIAGRRP